MGFRVSIGDGSLLPPGIERGNMKINVNDQVKVRLEPWARARVEQARQETGMPAEYCVVREDDQGWSSWQLWALMQEVGPLMQEVGLSGEPPFENEFMLARSEAG